MTSIVFPKLRLGGLSNHSNHSSHSIRSLLSKDDTTSLASASTFDEMFLTSKQDAEADCISEINDCFRNFGVRLPEEKIFRYANFYRFDAEDAIDRIREDNGNPYLNLKMVDLEDQFGSNAVFPLPMLRTRKTKSEVIFLNLARVIPSDGNDSDRFIESLCYVLNDLSQTMDQCRKGVTVIADMQDVTKENFSKEHCAKLMQALQGDIVPTHVESFLIVSPPSWFVAKVFRWMKAKRAFVRRIQQISPEQLPHFLMDDYEMYLPEGLCGGNAVGAEICEDYMDLMIAQEQQQQ